MSEQIERRAIPNVAHSVVAPLKTDDLRKALAFLLEGTTDQATIDSKFVRLKHGSRSVGLAAVSARDGLGSRLHRRSSSSHSPKSADSDPFCRIDSKVVA